MNLEIRKVESSELDAAFLVLKELREHLDFETFVRRLERQANTGYQLYGAYLESLAGVMGMRAVETMARGPHLHIDDLVVAKGFRAQGIGRSLIEFACQYARERSLGSIFLDSRREVLDFYEQLGFEYHSSLLMRKRVT